MCLLQQHWTVGARWTSITQCSLLFWIRLKLVPALGPTNFRHDEQSCLGILYLHMFRPLGFCCYLWSIICFDAVMPVKIGWVASKTRLTAARQNLGANRNSGDLLPTRVPCQYWTILTHVRVRTECYVAQKMWNFCRPSSVKHSWESAKIKMLKPCTWPDWYGRLDQVHGFGCNIST
jgi:hypothetical protein